MNIEKTLIETVIKEAMIRYLKTGLTQHVVKMNAESDSFDIITEREYNKTPYLNSYYDTTLRHTDYSIKRERAYKFLINLGFQLVNDDGSITTFIYKEGDRIIYEIELSRSLLMNMKGEFYFHNEYFNKDTILNLFGERENFDSYDEFSDVINKEIATRWRKYDLIDKYYSSKKEYRNALRNWMTFSLYKYLEIDRNRLKWFSDIFKLKKIVDKTNLDKIISLLLKDFNNETVLSIEMVAYEM